MTWNNREIHSITVIEARIMKWWCHQGQTPGVSERNSVPVFSQLLVSLGIPWFLESLHYLFPPIHGHLHFSLSDASAYSFFFFFLDLGLTFIIQKKTAPSVKIFNWFFFNYISLYLPLCLMSSDPVHDTSCIAVHSVHTVHWTQGRQELRGWRETQGAIKTSDTFLLSWLA